jgi:glycosyltransferase involved in cell wall biosynthesis
MSRLLPTVLRRAAAVIAVSEFTAADIAAWLPDVAGKIEVIPNGLHTREVPAAAAPGVVGDRPYALFLGTVNERKNVELLLRAMTELRRRSIDLRVVLAGGADPRIDTAAMVAAHGLTPDDVIVTGYVDEARAAALLRDAAMFVFPSLYEGFGMPLIEAMAAGVPVIAARSGAAIETVGEAGLLVDTADALDMAAAIERLLGDDALRASLVAAGRARASTFTWDRAAAQTLTVYRRLC